MPLPGLIRRSNSQRPREHRRIYNKYALGLQLLGLSVICISVPLTIFELSSDGYLGVGDGSHQMVDLGSARSIQLYSNRFREQSSAESNQQKVGSIGSQSKVGASVGPLFLNSEKNESVGKNVVSPTSESSTFGQRLLRFLAPWVSSSDIRPIVQTDTNKVDIGCDESSSSPDLEIPRVFSKCWKPPKPCATAEEMGTVAAGNTTTASLRIREMIKTWMRVHGAEVVRKLVGKEFCERKFVMGLASEDGFGNNMYKVLGAAGLALMLNRSLIIGERGANTPSYIGDPNNLVLPFGDYLIYSNQSFSMYEVKRLWVLHDCAGEHKRSMTMRVDDIEHGPGRSKSLCDDWTAIPDTVLWFKGTMDAVGLQFLLKNKNAGMRSAAAAVLGNPAFPSSRPNTFGELFRAFVTPGLDIQAAVQWALKGGAEPDFAIHLRLRHNRSLEAPNAASACLVHIAQGMQQIMPRKKQRVVVISDTPEVFSDLNQQLEEDAELIRFDYMEYLNTFKNLSVVMSLHYGEPPHSKLRDWGEMPRWVSLVDFFLASRARVAVISAASERVCTTYAQLVGSLAAASTTVSRESGDEAQPPCALYSSFQRDLVVQGLVKQSGWGHAWRTFGGRLGCKNQRSQCARTPLLPYAWWDAPWQSPTSRDRHIMRNMGIELDEVEFSSDACVDEVCFPSWQHPHSPYPCPEKSIPDKWHGRLPETYEPRWLEVLHRQRPQKDAGFIWSIYHCVNSWRAVIAPGIRSACECCSEALDETILHRFYQCPWAREAWDFALTVLYRYLNIAPTNGCWPGLTWQQCVLGSQLPRRLKKGSTLWSLFRGSVLWLCWIRRNAALFQQRTLVSAATGASALGDVH